MAVRFSLLIAGLAALVLWIALGASPPLRLDVGAAGDARFLWGFYSAEQGDGASFRWSGPEARLMLHGAPPGAVRLDLRLSGERLAAAGSPGVALGRGEATYAAFDVRPGWRVYRVLLPPGALADPWGGARPLALRSAVSPPGAGGDTRDYRELGLPLDRVTLAPVLEAPTGALPRAAWLAGALALLALAAGRLVPAAGPVIAGSLGLALVIGARRDAYVLAWALPIAPWALCVGAVLLLATRRGRPASGDPSAGMVTRKGQDGRVNKGLAGTPPRAARVDRSRHVVERNLIAALLGLAAGVALMHTHLAVVPGFVLAALALLALAAPAGGLGAAVWAGGEDAPHRSVVPAAVAVLFLALIVLLALGLRLARIDALPFGLWRDEARHGLVALRIVEDPTFRPIYVGDRVDLPGLGFYAFAAAIQLFGVHLWTLRLVTALAGALTVLPLYAVAARLTGRREVALVAALLLAVSSWHITISRFAFPTVFEPLLSLTAWWLLLVGMEEAGTGRSGDRGLVDGHPGEWVLRANPIWLRIGAGLLGGALLGVAAQTYHTGRVTPLAAVWLCVLLVARVPGQWRRRVLVAGVAALGFGLTVAPLAGYALTRGAEFNDRVGAVFLFGADALKARAPLAALDANLGRHLLMFTAEGDANGRHHAPFRPLLDSVSGTGLLLGVAALLRRLDDWRSRFLLGALAIGLLPGLLAVDAPHAMRTFGAVAPALIIAALGWAELWRVARRANTLAGGRAAEQRSASALLAPPSLPGPRDVIALGFLAAALVALNAGLYFGVMPRDPRVFAGFYPVQSWMGVYVGAHQGPGRIYVPEGILDQPSFAFLAAGREVETYRSDPPGAPAVLSTPAAPGDSFLLTGYFADAEAAALAGAIGPLPARESGPPFPDGRGATYYVVRATQAAAVDAAPCAHGRSRSPHCSRMRR